MYEVVTEHAYQFCVPKGHQMNDYPLIEWCAQYLTPLSNFIDIGTDVGYYSVILSQYCKHVYSFNVDEKFETTLKLNQLTNITISNDFNIKDVSFLKISNYPLEQCIDLLRNNNYPPFIFDHQDHCLVKSMRYQVYSIGYNMYLASDNPIFKSSFIDEGMKRYEEITLSDQPLIERQNALRDSFIYMKPLSYIKKINLNCPMINSPTNASIIKIDNGYLCYIGKLLFLDLDFNITKTVVLKDVTNRYDKFMKGIYHIRLINSEYFICSYGNNIQTIQSIGTIKEDQITSLTHIELSQYKNILPYYNDKLYYISINPYIVYNEQMIKVKQYDCLLDFKGYVPCIPYKNGWLSVIYQSTQESYHFHRFIWFGNDIKYSAPFYFESKGEELCWSICHSDQGLIIIYNTKLIMIEYDLLNKYLQL